MPPLPETHQPTVYQIGAVAHAPHLAEAFAYWSDRWAAEAGLGERERPRLERLDVRPKQGWAAVVAAMAGDPAVWGALVFEAKAALLAHAADIFSAIGADARLTGEVNVLSAERAGLAADNTGIDAAARSLERTLGAGYWADRKGAALVIYGAGARAAAFALAVRRELGAAAPAIKLIDRDAHALATIGAMAAADASGAPPPKLASGLADHRLAPGSVVLHAPRPCLSTSAATAPVLSGGGGLPAVDDGLYWDLDLDPDSPFARGVKRLPAAQRSRFVGGDAHYRLSLEIILRKIFDGV